MKKQYNPSIEWTATGKPVSAAHVKRYSLSIHNPQFLHLPTTEQLCVDTAFASS